jgi:hypothetical protein
VAVLEYVGEDDGVAILVDVDDALAAEAVLEVAVGVGETVGLTAAGDMAGLLVTVGEAVALRLTGIGDAVGVRAMVGVRVECGLAGSTVTVMGALLVLTSSSNITV